jgi:hypothetical protein
MDVEGNYLLSRKWYECVEFMKVYGFWLNSDLNSIEKMTYRRICNLYQDLAPNSRLQTPNFMIVNLLPPYSITH